MPTTKKRVNISLPPDLERELARVAKRDAVPEATKAAQLLRVALEIEEDAAFDAIASKRFQNAKTWLTHGTVWGT